jgi:hypothetical protein
MLFIGEHMADNTANVKINIDDQGSADKVNKKVDAIRAAIEKAVTMATKLPSALSAAQAGTAAGNGRAASAADTRQSGLARSIGPGTGAEGRDFAKQAAGLGGLVRVYATFAANIFAATAAFSALSKAMDTSNMIKGLSQLGAAAGRDLGSLSKRLVEVTDGAISMREAMTATAQGSAGGLSGANLIRLGNVAKNASQALGVAMPDAISRLTRGITKLEPELLDEIGILVRVDKASADYARSIGKSAASLTDFEKRQAFANAVLEQGEAKFGAIQIDSNPYAKILASMENIAFTGLNLLNTVLGPVLNILSSSPTALAAAMAGIATVLLRQAIPALGQWKAGLADAAKRADELLIATNDRRKAIIYESGEQENSAVNARLFAAEAKAQDALTKAKLNARAATSKVLPDNIAAIDIQALEKRKNELAKNLVKSEETLAKTQDSRTAKAIVANKLETQGVAALILAKKELLAAEAALQANIDQPPTGLLDRIDARARDKIADRAAARSQRTNIISSVTTDQGLTGTVGAYKELNRQIELAKSGKDAEGKAFTNGQKAMSNSNAVLTKVAGAAAIAASAIQTLHASFTSVLLVVGIAVVAFQVLDNVLSVSTKQAANFTTALDALESAADNVDKTIDAIGKKGMGNILTPESIQARANAYQELSDSVLEAGKAFDKLQAAQGKWEKFFDGLWDAVGKGQADKLASNLALTISESFRLLEESPAKEEARKSIQEIVGQKVDITSLSSIESSLRSLSNPEISLAIGKLGLVFKQVSRETSNAAAASVAAKAAFVETGKILNDISTSLKLGDNIAKLGSSAITAGLAFTDALKSPINSIATLNELVNNTQTLSILPKDTQSKLIAAKVEINKTTEELGKYTAELETAKKAKLELDKQTVPASRASSLGLTDNATEELAKAKADSARNITKLEATIASAKNAAAKLVTSLATALPNDFFIVGAKKLEDSLKGAFEKGALIVQRGYLSVIQAGGGSTAEMENKLRQKEIDVQINSIKAQFSLIKALEETTIAIERDTNSRDIEANKPTRFNDSKEVRDKYNSLLATRDVLDQRAKLTKSAGSSGNAAKEYSAGLTNDATREATKQMSGFYERLIGQQGALAEAYGQKAAQLIEGKFKVLQENTTKSKQGLDENIGKRTTEIKGITSAEQSLGIYNKELANRREVLELANLKDTADKEILDSNLKLSALGIGLSNTAATAAQKDALRADIAKEVNRNVIIQNRLVTDTAQVTADSLAKERTGRLELFKLELDSITRLREANVAKYTQELEAQDASIDYNLRQNTISAEQAANDKGNIAIRKEELAVESQVFTLRQAQLQLEAEQAKKRLDVQSSPTGGTNTALAALDAEAARTKAISEAQVAAANAIGASKIKTLEITKAETAELARQQTVLSEITALTTSLGVVFGDIGTNLGNAVTALAELANTELNYLTTRNKLEDEKVAILNDAGKSPEDKAKDILAVNKKLARSDAENTKAQLGNITAIAGSTKKMFSEKTAAYKVLSGIEKASAAYSAVLRAKELVEVAASTAAKIGIKIPEIFATAMATLGPFLGPAAAAAAIAAFLGGFGGGSSGGAPVISAADKQAVQGTGTSYNNKGEKVENGGGVFGDTEAKSQSIVNSLEIIRDNTIDGLAYDNRMLKALTSIESSIGETAKSIYSIQGIRTGSSFGTTEGSQSSGINNLFGKTTNTAITDAGILIAGTFTQLAASANGLINVYEDITTTTERSGFFGIGGGTSTSNSRNVTGTGTSDLAAQVTSIFKESKELFITVGEQLGISAVTTLQKLNSLQPINVEASLRGLKGAELEEELNSLISGILDTTSAAVFSSVSQFKKFGEGLLETAIRVADSNKKATAALSSIGSTAVGTVAEVILSASGAFQSVRTVFKELSFVTSEALVKNAGGIEEFTSQIEFFSDNFLTSAQQLVPITSNVVGTMRRLGYASVDTRAEFAALVKSIDVSTAAGRTLYQSLMDIAPAFAEVYAATKEALSGLDLLNAKRDQEIIILGLLGKTSEALALTRAKELETMDAALKPTQLYIYALQDEITARGLVTKAVESTIAGLKTSINVLKEFKASLLIGATSTLTPAQKYAQTQAELDATTAVAKGPATTTAEIAARDAAINKLPSLSNAFLEASRVMFASSSQYTADFNSVLATLNSTSSSLESQLSDAEKQLAVLQTSEGYLNSIRDSSKTTATLMAEWIATVNKVAPAREVAAIPVVAPPPPPPPVPTTRPPTSSIPTTPGRSTALSTDTGADRVVTAVNDLRDDQNAQTDHLAEAILRSQGYHGGNRGNNKTDGGGGGNSGSTFMMNLN